MTSDDEEIVSAGDDGTVRVWRLRTREERLTLTGHKGTVRAVAVTPDGTAIVSGGYDGTARIWDRFSGGQLNVLSGHTGTVRAVTVTRDGEEVVTAGHDGTIHVYNLRNGAQRLALQGGKGPVEALAVTPDNHEIVSTGYGGTIQVWNRHTGDERATFFGHGKELISGVTVSPDGLELVTVGYDGAVEVRSCATGEVRFAIPVNKDGLEAVALTPDGRAIVTAARDGIVRAWSMSDGECLSTLSGHTGAVTGLSTSSHQIVSAGHDGIISIWETSGEQRMVLTGHTSPIEAVTVTIDDKEIVTVGADGTGRVWNRWSGALLMVLEGHEGPVLAVAITPDDKQIVTGGSDHTIRVWNRSNGKQQELLRGHQGVVRAVAITADGHEIVSTADDNTIRIWNRHTGEERKRFEAKAAGLIPGLAITPDDRDIVVTGFDGTIDIRDRVTGEHRHVLTGDGSPLETIAVTHDKEDIVTGGNDGAVRIWNRHSGAQQGVLTGHQGRVERVTVTLDDAEIVTAGDDGTVRIWGRRTESQRAELGGHIGPALGLAITRDGEEIVSTGYDGTIRIWNRRRAHQVRGTEVGGAGPAKRLAGVRSDLPSTEDLLDLSDDIDMLASLVAARTTEPPLSIALLGEWGSGKSSFMLQMEAEIKRLAELSANNLSQSAFTANIHQIHFNAWHYSDDHLWSGLAEHLFRSLAGDTPTEDLDPEIVRSRRDDLLTKLTEGEYERDRLDAELKEVETASRQPSPLVGWLVRTGILARVAARQLVNDLRANRGVLALCVVVVVVALIGGIFFQHLVAPILALASGLVATLGWVTHKFRTIRNKAIDFTNTKYTGLVDRHDEAARAVVNLKEQLATVDAETRLSAFLNERADGATYQQFRGLVGQIHIDLKQLDSDLREARNAWSSSWSTEHPPLERIVLYIDDLDRCPPDLVVQVLAALNLLLALPLFVVVVAVDQRWLVRSLEFHHCELFGSQTGDGEPTLPESIEIASLDYLDKVFQLPFALRPMGENTSGYLDALLGPSTAEPAPHTGDAAGETTRDGEEGPQAVDPLVPIAPEDSTTAPPSVAAGGDERDHSIHDRLSQLLEEDRHRAAGKALRDLRPEGLSLRRIELDFMRSLWSLLPTPRAAKKLTNIYRLIRIGIPEDSLDQFIGDEETGVGPYQAVLVLLVITVSMPAVARRLFPKLGTTPADNRIQAVIREVSDTPDGPSTSDLKTHCGQIVDLLESIQKHTPLIEDLIEYKRWAPHVTRFSFHTRGYE